MKSTPMAAVTILAALTFTWTVNATQKSVVATTPTPQVTVPNGHSPAKANAPRAPMNDTDAMRSAWNHGNGALWVNLAPNGVLTIAAPAQTDDESVAAIKGYSRLKFGWWRGVAGKFTIEGRRLDGAAPPLRYRIQEDAYGAFGFIPSSLYFPSEGYWEITGHLDNQRLTVVVRVTKDRG